MIISSTLENKEIEKRIAVTPEITKKYINLGFKIQLIKNYGKHIGFEDSHFKDAGATIINDEKEVDFQSKEEDNSNKSKIIAKNKMLKEKTKRRSIEKKKRMQRKKQRK